MIPPNNSQTANVVDIPFSSLFNRLPTVLEASVIVGVTLFLALFYRVVLYPRFVSPLRHVPGPPLGGPIVGRMGDILKNEAGIIQREWVHEYGGLVRAVGPMGMERLIVSDADLLKHVMVNASQEYRRDPFSQDVLGILAGYGIFHENGEKHRFLRRALGPAFTVSALSAQTEMLYGPTETLVEMWENQIDAAERTAGKDTGTQALMFEWSTSFESISVNS